MNEIYKLLLNVQEIVKANNLFLQSFEQRIDAMEQRIGIMERSMVIDVSTSEPNAAGAETTEE